MRIISGQYKGKNITAPSGLPVRPTTDFAKTGLFNILQHRIDFPSCSVLDLCSGTGNISYEFASRGAASITCVEQNGKCCQFIRSTMQMLNYKPVQLLCMEVTRALRTLTTSFDIIFADPPFDSDLIVTLPELILTSGKLNTGGTFILEHRSNHPFTGKVKPNETRVYGNCAFSFFEQNSFIFALDGNN